MTHQKLMLYLLLNLIYTIEMTPFVLQRQTYYLVSFRSGPSVYWKNNMDIIYVYSSEDQSFIKCGLEDEYFYKELILKESTTSEELIKEQLRQETIKAYKSLVSLPFEFLDLFILYPLSRRLRKLRRTLAFPFAILWIRIKGSLWK